MSRAQWRYRQKYRPILRTALICSPVRRVTGYDTIMPCAMNGAISARCGAHPGRRQKDAGVLMKVFTLPDLGEGLAEAEVRGM